VQTATGTKKPRSARTLVVAFVAAVVIAGAGGVVGGRLSQQTVRTTIASKPLITMPIVKGVLKTSAVFRATLADVAVTNLPAPSSLDGSLPVATSLAVHPGDLVQDGELLGTVAERPVIVMHGAIPAFRTMEYGTTGTDVEELQAGLTEAGISIGDDTAGVYGPGTAAAVNLLYERLQVTPLTQAVSLREGRGNKPEVEHYAIVPRGEVAFVRNLPVRVVRVDAKVGQLVRDGFVALGSSALRLTGTTTDATALRAGQRGIATSDVGRQRLAVRVASVLPQRAQSATPNETRIILLPVGHVPAELVGQNLRVAIQLRSTRKAQLLVPLAAVITTATGQSYVVVVGRHSRKERIPVATGLIAAGREVVISPRLHPGEMVSLGVAG
jgi:hypothetical protein